MFCNPTLRPFFFVYGQYLFPSPRPWFSVARGSACGGNEQIWTRSSPALDGDVNAISLMYLPLATLLFVAYNTIFLHLKPLLPVLPMPSFLGFVLLVLLQHCLVLTRRANTLPSALRAQYLHLTVPKSGGVGLADSENTHALLSASEGGDDRCNVHAYLYHHIIDDHLRSATVGVHVR